MSSKRKSNKLLTELSNEELLKVLDDSEELLPENDVIKFISFYKIAPGKDLVMADLLYYIYSHWSKEKLPRKEFIKQLSFQVPHGPKGFLINEKAINFSKKALEIIKSRDKTKSKNYKIHFEAFLNRHEFLKKPTGWLQDDFLYNLYKTDYKGLSFRNFKKFLKLYFEQRNNYSETFSWYKMNITPEITKTRQIYEENKKRIKKIPRS